MAKPSNPQAPSLLVYAAPTASLVVGVPGRATFGALERATAVFDDYTKRTRKGLKKDVAAPFRVTATLCGDVSKASDDTEVAFVVGVVVATTPKGSIEINAAEVRQALTVVGRRWLTLDAFEDAELAVEHAYAGWLVASGPKAKARIVYESPTAAGAVVTASTSKPGEFDAQAAALEDCFMIAS